MMTEQNEEYIDTVRRFFCADRFATEAAGLQIVKAEPGYAKVAFDIDDIHMNAAGGLMGGAIFTAADFAFAVATNAEDCLTVTVNSNISYLSACKGKRLFAETACDKKGKTLCYYTIDITDELGTRVAKVLTTGMTVQRK